MRNYTVTTAVKMEAVKKAIHKGLINGKQILLDIEIDLWICLNNNVLYLMPYKKEDTITNANCRTQDGTDAYIVTRHFSIHS